MSDPHIAAEELAAFAAGTLDVHAAKRVVDHLEACPRCSEAFRTGVRLLGAVGDELPPHSLPEEVLNRARHATPQTGRSRRRSPTRRRSLWPVTAATAVVVVTGLMLWPNGVNRPEPVDLSGFPLIEKAAGLSGSQSMLVIPGAEDFIESEDPPQRSGAPATAPELEELIDELLGRYRSQSLTAEQTYALIAGELLSGDYRTASELVGDANQLFGEHAEFSAAEGIALFHLEQLPGARAAFEKAIRLDPNRAVHYYNLAVVLRELGDDEGVRAAVDEVQESAPETPLAERASDLLPRNG